MLDEVAGSDVARPLRGHGPRSARRRRRRPALIAASAAACSRRPTAPAALRLPAIPTIPRISDGSAPRVRRSTKRWRSTGGCCIRCCAISRGRLRARELGRGAGQDGATSSREIIERRRPQRRRGLSFRSIADRGLLRRQQADEGLYRLVQCRHQFSPVHGLDGRRANAAPSAPTPCRAVTKTSTTADLIVLVGSNAAWCHPILFQRMLRNKQERGAKIVVIDPRRTATSRGAPICFLEIAPGMDQALFCGLLVHLAKVRRARSRISFAVTRRGSTKTPCTRRGPSRRRSQRRRRSPDCAKSTLPSSSRCSPRRRATVTCFSQGVNQSAQGTDKVNAIINCHLATGRIGKPGASPFSLTGQPNAMGGREVGGLANQLAAHMGFDAGKHRSRSPLLECAAHGRRATGSRRCRCSTPSRAATSRRCG